MNSNHTEGPWHTDGLAVVGPSPELEICICRVDADIKRFEANANAALIAAAPDMLAALQDSQASLLRWLEYDAEAWDERDRLTLSNIEAAIKKATP